MAQSIRQLAVVTGASSGIGYELARCCAENGFDLVIAADEPEIAAAANALRRVGAQVETDEADLATIGGVDILCQRIQALNRPVDALLANAGHGLGKGFLDQDFADIRHVIDTNVTGTVHLLQRIGPRVGARLTQRRNRDTSAITSQIGTTTTAPTST